MPNGWISKVKLAKAIGSKQAAKLNRAGIRSAHSLLENAATPEGRALVATQARLPRDGILRLVSHVDLFRLRGVGTSYADLLEAAGVDSVVELAARKPRSLHNVFVRLNEKRKIVQKLPTEVEVKHWVAQAKRLPKIVKY